MERMDLDGLRVSPAWRGGAKHCAGARVPDRDFDFPSLLPITWGSRGCGHRLVRVTPTVFIVPSRATGAGQARSVHTARPPSDGQWSIPLTGDNRPRLRNSISIYLLGMINTTNLFNKFC